MKNNVQITLFLNKNTIYDSEDLAHELHTKIDELANPTILSENKVFPEEANAPILLFINNPDIQFISNYYTITISFSKEKINKLDDYMLKIMDVLQDLKIRAYRVGYVVNMEYDSDKIFEFKEKTILNDTIKSSEDFELSWLNYIDICGISVNCWHRYFTNKQLNDKLNILYDVNTKQSEQCEIDSNFVLKFIDESQKYIDGLK